MLRIAPRACSRSGKSRGDVMRRPLWWRLLVEGSIMATKNPTPDDSGVMLIAVLAILASRIDAPYAFAGCVLVVAVILVRWLRR